MKQLKLTYDEYGEADKPVLIILHGFFASSRNWRSIARQLQDDFHIFVPDQRNHGASPHAEPMDYPTMAKDMVEFLQQHDLKQAHFLGHSMGGKVAMVLALNHPEMIDKLIIADISPSNYQHSFDQTIQALKNIPLDQIQNRKQADDYLAKTIEDESYRQFLLQNLGLDNGHYRWRVDLDLFQRYADKIVGFPPIAAEKVYAKPALFLGGEQSDYIRKDDVYRYFPHAIIKYLANASHWLHVQAPQAFCQEVQHFLKARD
jgi:pimeloyl-ACP methyl ester carboxylesterase